MKTVATILLVILGFIIGVTIAKVGIMANRMNVVQQDIEYIKTHMIQDTTKTPSK
jgi:hypothetical protein